MDRLNKAQTADTESTRSTGTYPDEKERHISVSSEQSLIKLGKNLDKDGSAYSEVKSMHLSFNSDPTRKIIKMKQLGEIFVALASLPKLEEVMFRDAVFFLPTVNKLFKKSSLRSIKFHHCKFILSRQKDNCSKQAIEKLWNGIQLQQNLSVLEIVDCRYSSHETLCLDASSRTPKFAFQMPLFLLDQKLSKLRRLVLDECILDNAEQSAFVKLLNNNQSLEELEIRPGFETSDCNRREQYQAKKQAIRKFMTETVPKALASDNNTCLRKLVVSLEDYHLEKVHAEAMASWVELVQFDNSVVTDLRATYLPLPSSSFSPENVAENDDESIISPLQANLEYFLRLNAFRKSLPTYYQPSCHIIQN